MRLALEVEGESGAPPPALPGDGAALVAFMSFAVVRGFGAMHPLVVLADRLASEHRVKLGPLTTFYERYPEDSEDVQQLEMAWQDAAPLRDALRALCDALNADQQARHLLQRAEATALPAQAEALLAHVAAAADRGKRVRLVYDL